MNTVYDQLEPQEVWRHFSALNEIPRPSGQEEQARDYVRRVAEQNGAVATQDARGNLVVLVPARGGKADGPVAAVQGHLDMVCQKRPEIAHDFDRDPIRPRREGDWIFASGTTLGADNGLGAAMMLAALTDQTIEHGPLELVFTVEEETGLYGAAELDAALISAQYLINLDSEDPDEITIGCAGGAGANVHLPAATSTVENGQAFYLTVGGLAGGHSGMQINEPLANALKLLTQMLTEMNAASPIRLASLRGGNAHNAIPRDAEAFVICDKAAQAALQTARATINARWREHEPNLKIELREGETVARAWNEMATREALDLLHDLPHGVLQMSNVFEGKVETSANLAIVALDDEALKLHVSVRSFRGAEIQRVLNEIEDRAMRAGASTEIREGYPGWEPEADSTLLERTREAFVHTQGKEPVVQVVHAGLECGLLVAKKPGLEAISFGPHIRGAHTPEECVEIRSVATSWSLLRALLKDLAQ
ncbi:MAG TPA: beta-Ala-His dipeptidase [Abditibacteriaceae bacterium]|jgi:dipeptidase D